MDRPISVGIVGAGRIGSVHARSIARGVPAARLAAVADPVLPAAERLGAELGIPRATADYRDLLRDPGIDAVLVCSSTDTHAEVVTQAALAGKQIFCEKPLDKDLERMDRVIEEVERSGVKLMMGFNRRFDADFARIREQVASGAIGTPELLRITSRDPAPPSLAYVRVSGGLFMDMTIHDFDMARFLLGREVLEVSVAADALVDPAIGGAGDVDTAIVTLRFSGGALGAIDNSRRSVYGYDQRVEVFGSGGMLANRNHRAHTVEHADREGFHGDPALDFFMQRYAQAYTAEIRSFVECVIEGTPVPVGAPDARAAAVMAYAAARSHRERRPVAISEVSRA